MFELIYREFTSQLDDIITIYVRTKDLNYIKQLEETYKIPIKHFNLYNDVVEGFFIREIKTQELDEQKLVQKLEEIQLRKQLNQSKIFDFSLPLL
jgi:hypothetical protein